MPRTPKTKAAPGNGPLVQDRYMSSDNNLARIEHALDLARQVVSTFTSGRIKAELKADSDPVTAADIEL